MLGDPVVVLFVLVDSVAVLDTEETASDKEVIFCVVSAAGILLLEAATSGVEVWELAGTSENLLQETKVEVDGLRVVDSIVVSRKVLAKVGFEEEIVIDGSVEVPPSHVDASCALLSLVHIAERETEVEVISEVHLDDCHVGLGPGCAVVVVTADVVTWVVATGPAG